MSYNYLNEDNDSIFDNETNDLHNDPSLASNVLWSNDDLSLASNDINWNTLFDNDSYDPIDDKIKDKLLDFDDSLHGIDDTFNNAEIHLPQIYLSEFNELFEPTIKSTIKQELIHTNSVSSSYLTDECSPNSSNNNSPVGRKVKKREFQIMDSSSEKSFTLENSTKATKIDPTIHLTTSHSIKKEPILQYPARKIYKVSRDAKLEPRESIFIGNLSNPRQIVKIRHQPNTGTPYILSGPSSGNGTIKSVNIQKYSSHQPPQHASFPEKLVVESAACSSASSSRQQYSPDGTEADDCDLLTGDYYDHEIDLYSDYKPRGAYLGSAGGYGSLASSHHSGSGTLFQTPIPQSGPLYLTDEEKRTLIQENYPIPTRLPLTKQEERNLKKVRRKIKNKISAQESRRKKKEYVDALEKKVEAYELELLNSKRRIETLETQQRTLQNHVRHLQHQALNKITGTGNTTSTGLMLFMICFALILVGGSVPSSYRRMNLPQSSLLLSSSSLYHMGYGPSRGGLNATPHDQYQYSYRKLHHGDGGGTQGAHSSIPVEPASSAPQSAATATVGAQGDGTHRPVSLDEHKSTMHHGHTGEHRTVVVPRQAILLGGDEVDERNFEELVLSIMGNAVNTGGYGNGGKSVGVCDSVVGVSARSAPAPVGGLSHSPRRRASNSSSRARAVMPDWHQHQHHIHLVK